MTSSSDTDFSDLIQVVRSSRKVRHLVEDLTSYYNIESIEEEDGYSKVECSDNESEVLKKVREEFKKDWNRDKKVVVTSFIETDAD